MHGRPVPTRPGPRGPIGWESVAKPGGGARLLIRLDANDERRYTRSVARVTPWVDRARGTTAFANGVERVDTTGIVLRPWTDERRRWTRAKDRWLSDANAVAVTDVHDCYASIAPEVIIARLLELGAPETFVEEIGGWLRGFHDEGIRGLPAGPPASALLADAVLPAGDVALRPIARHVRWVDDVAIFAGDRRRAASALDDLRAAWTPLGLELHPGKTAILDPDEAGGRLTGTSTSGPPALR